MYSDIHIILHALLICSVCLVDTHSSRKRKFIYYLHVCCSRRPLKLLCWDVNSGSPWLYYFLNRQTAWPVIFNKLFDSKGFFIPKLMAKVNYILHHLCCDNGELSSN